MTDPEPPSERDEPQEQDDEQQKQEKWNEPTRYQILLFAGGIALFGLVLGLILDWYIDPQTSTQKKDLVQALGLITAGVAGAVGIYFTWRGQRIAQRDQERSQRNTQEQLNLTRQSQVRNQQATQAQLENAQEELRLTRQGQITERFTRAIDQLGNESLEIRLGGIYALERIAHESEQDYWPIMEILTAYVRQHARWPQSRGGEEGEDGAAVEKPTEPLAPGPDILAIMTVLRRRTHSLGFGEPEPLDLQRTNLSGADLRLADLQRTNLKGANLRGANLRGADLSTADVRQEQLEYAIGDRGTQLPPNLKPPRPGRKN